mgnify:CR=1 FL=1
MKFAFASAALVCAVTLTGAASAAGLVPGSDHYRDAAADRAAHSVVIAEPGAVRETLSYGYPLAGTGAIVPGSEANSRAREGAAIDSVIRSAPSAGFQAGPRAGGLLVPGSDSF